MIKNPPRSTEQSFPYRMEISDYFLIDIPMPKDRSKINKINFFNSNANPFSYLLNPALNPLAIQAFLAASERLFSKAGWLCIAE